MKFEIGDKVVIVTRQYGTVQEGLEGTIVSLPGRSASWYRVEYTKESAKKHGHSDNSYRAEDIQKITKLHKVLK